MKPYEINMKQLEINTTSHGTHVNQYETNMKLHDINMTQHNIHMK